MKFASLFTGIGGFDLGFEQAGMECAHQVEQDAACLRLLGERWPGVPKQIDVRGLEHAGTVDLICGGFPCQDLSVAGKRAGLAGARSGLWFEFRRIIAESRPGWVVIENVPGLLSSNGGRDFAVILRGLVELGYGVAWRILDAQWFGVPQRRRRVFIVGHLGDGCASQVLFEPEGLCRDTPSRREAGTEAAHSVRASTGSRGTDDPDRMTFVPFQETRRGWWNDAPIAQAIRDASLGGGSHANLMAFDTTQITSKGNYSNPQAGVPCHPLAAGAHAPAIAFTNHGREGVETLRSASHGATPMVAYAFNAKDRHGAHAVFGFQSRIARNGRGQPTDVVPALRGSEEGDMADSKPLISVGSAVRRLTPTECERLQSFPDGWTAGFADNVRYKMLGNAVTVNVARWIGQRLMQAEVTP